MSVFLLRLRPFRRPLYTFSTRSTTTATTALPRIPTLREQLARTSPNPSIFASIRTPPIWKHVLLATLSCILIYDSASSETNRVTDLWSERVGIRYTLAGPRAPTSHDVRAAKQKALFERLVAFNESVTAFAEHWFVPPILKPVIRTAYIWCANHWIAANEGVRAAYVLNAVHLGVYLVGKVPRLRGFFGRHLVHDPLSGRAHTILTGLLHHRSFLHLAVNSAFLTAFANTSTLWLSLEDSRFSPDGVTHIPEVTTAYHFLALYACAGILSSVVAHVVHARVVYPRIVRRLASSSSPTPSISSAVTPSSSAAAATGEPNKRLPICARLAVLLRGRAALSKLGPALEKNGSGRSSSSMSFCGSGPGLYAVVALTVFAFPSGSVGLVFFPSQTVDMRTGLGALTLFHLVGVLRGWRRFNHIAALASIAFGAAYASYGVPLWIETRVVDMQVRAEIEEEDRREEEEEERRKAEGAEGEGQSGEEEEGGGEGENEGDGGESGEGGRRAE